MQNNTNNKHQNHRTTRRTFLATTAGTVLSGNMLARAADATDTPADPFSITRTWITEGYDGQMCWVHARGDAIPGKNGSPPTVVVTMQKLLLSGSDVFYAIHSLETGDGGKHWTEPATQPTLDRTTNPDGTVTNVCDMTPAWHAASGKLLATGQTVVYQNNKVMPVRTRETPYTVYDPETKSWSEYRLLKMPDFPQFKNAGAGCTQRFDLPNGDILLPIYFKEPEQKNTSVTVVRCSFDGETLRYIEHGSEHTCTAPRGMGEPSLTCFGGRYFLTIRNDETGYVTSSDDGLHFDEPKAWQFDDGPPLGSYNTQQHWLTHSSGMYLVYTRRGADNDHVFRHRAPLFIAQVDPEKLCVIRSTERVLGPERGARLGNFGVTQVGPEEFWVIVTEWMQPAGCEKHGSNNRIWCVKVRFDAPLIAE